MGREEESGIKEKRKGLESENECAVTKRQCGLVCGERGWRIFLVGLLMENA